MPRSKILMKVKKQYVNRVRECRLLAMIPKQEDLSKLTGISRGIINALENNRLFLSSYYALLISEVLGCRLEELYERKNPKEGHREEKKQIIPFHHRKQKKEIINE